MKMKYYILLITGITLLLGACDYNDRNFDGLDDLVRPVNVATYEIEYDGDYPTDGYFSSKQEVAETVAKWLAKNYFACDSGSLAKVSLLYADSVEIPEVTQSYTLVKDDYQSMGTGKGMPGQYNNFSSSIDPDHYLPVFLKMKFPYATSETVMAVTFVYYAGSSKDSTMNYSYDGNTWTNLKSMNPVTVSTKVAEFSFSSEWKLDKILGGIEKYVLAKEDYQVLFDWVKANKPEYLSTQKPETDEYYFGVATKYSNVNNKVSTWKSYYNVGNEYDGKTDDQVREIMYARMGEGLATLVLPLHYTQPQSGINYQITYTVYGGLADEYMMTFMYDDTEQKFYKSAGPVY